MNFPRIKEYRKKQTGIHPSSSLRALVPPCEPLPSSSCLLAINRKLCYILPNIGVFCVSDDNIGEKEHNGHRYYQDAEHRDKRAHRFGENNPVRAHPVLQQENSRDPRGPGQGRGGRDHGPHGA